MIHKNADGKYAVDKQLTFSDAVEESSSGMMISNAEGMIEYVNPSFARLTGYAPEELLGKNSSMLRHPDESAPVQYRSLLETLRHGGEWRKEIKLIRKSGELYWASETISAIRDAAGAITHLLTIQQDITNAKRVEEALRESEERFFQIADMGGEWLWEQDPEGRYIYSSSAVKAIVGYEPEEVVGRSFYELFTVEDQPPVSKENYVSDNREPFFGLINHFRHKDGRIIITESTDWPVVDADGRLIKWCGVDRDITERLQAEEGIRRAHVKLAVAKNEMKIAREVQDSLLPAIPLVMPGLRVRGKLVPAAQVGGDYFDYFRRWGNFVDVVIADVSGQTMGAALIMAGVRSTLKAEIRNAELGQVDSGPGEILHGLNELMYDDLSRANRFITMFHLNYNVESRLLRYAKAGHDCALLLRVGEQTCEELDAEGLFLGATKESAFEERHLQLAKGDRVLLYTDGVTEAQSQEGEIFGVSRLCELFSAHRLSTPETAIEHMVNALRDFCSGQLFKDNITLVLLETE